MSILTRLLAWTLLPLCGLVFLPRTAQAQMGMGSAGRSLGGYGASTIGSYYSSGTAGYLPYNGNGSGFVTSRPGIGLTSSPAPVSRRLGESSIGGTLMPSTPIGGTSLSAGMGTRSASGMNASSLPRTFIPFGYEGGIGMGSGMNATPSGMAKRKLSGPGFGYPFRMPASLNGSSSMAMP